MKNGVESAIAKQRLLCILQCTLIKGKSVPEPEQKILGLVPIGETDVSLEGGWVKIFEGIK